MKYTVVILRRAQKELAAISSPMFEKLERKLLGLADDPRPPGCAKLEGREGAWRLRAGDYRIIYEIDDSAKLVNVVRIGHRREIYQ